MIIKIYKWERPSGWSPFSFFNEQTNKDPDKKITENGDQTLILTSFINDIHDVTFNHS